MQPLVSICIPCYNAAPFIGETLQSVLAQTYTNLEIIICDDQSKDNTIEIVKTFSDPRISIHVNEQNLGSSGNYNKALSYATGTYAKLFCADDLITPDCIEKQVRAFEENSDKNIVLVTAEKRIINQNGKHLFVKKFPGKGGIIDGKKVVQKSIRNGTNIIGEPGLPLMKTDVLRKTSGVIEDKYFTYCNDFDLFCKMLLHGNLFVIKEPLFFFRIVTTSTTSKAGWQQAKVVKDYFTLLYQQKLHDISKATLLFGKFMVNVMTFARNMMYKFM
ncbi:MAG: glycosyltransferase [Bacteroidales bacterium]|nr:glycosyltransferase [Bacteroidales bacterium]